MAEAVHRASGRLSAFLLMGDMNDTMSPTPASLATMGRIGGTAMLLQMELASAGSLGEEIAVVGLSQELKTSVTEHLCTPALRTEMMAMDSCPKVLGCREGGRSVEGQQMTALQLVDMPASSWPTYRLCTPDQATFEEFRKAGAALEWEEGVLFMSTALELSSAAVETCFFGGSNGRAGAIKKYRGMRRLGMGWLDRLYVSTRREDPIGVNITQGTPVFLISQEGEALDHALIPWLAVFTTPLSSPTRERD